MRAKNKEKGIFRLRVFWERFKVIVLRMYEAGKATEANSVSKDGNKYSDPNCSPRGTRPENHSASVANKAGNNFAAGKLGALLRVTLIFLSNKIKGLLTWT